LDKSLPLETPNLTKSHKKKQQQHRQHTQSHKTQPNSDQADQHIAYLEAELAAYQAQLASLTSPSVTKEKTHKIRLLNQDIRRLEEENSRWEADFDQRVLQVIQEHDNIEYNLRQKIALLEADGEKHSQKVKELQAQLDSTRKGLHVAEAANVEFEKRLETFAHLLVTSPIRTDMSLAQPPFARDSRSIRQKRLSFHRFPTAGSFHQQASVLEHQDVDLNRPLSEGAVIYDSDVEWDASKQESFISDTPRNSVNFDHLLNQDPSAPAYRARPNRRMRRFHGGSHLPKPLILSSAQLPPVLASAPLFEAHESPPSAFPFPHVQFVTRRASCHDFTPSTGRPRARTNADGLSLSFLSPRDPIVLLPPSDDFKTPTQPKPFPESTPCSSIGPSAGRNLLDELYAARNDGDGDDTTIEISSSPVEATPVATLNSKPSDECYALNTIRSSSSISTSIGRSVSGTLRLRHQRSISEATGLSMFPMSSSRRVSSSSQQASGSQIDKTKTRSGSKDKDNSNNNTILARLIALLQSPYSMVKLCVSRAHRAFMLSRTLRRFQWMLLHAVLGPLATRKLMACQVSADNKILAASLGENFVEGRGDGMEMSDDEEDDFEDERDMTPRPLHRQHDQRQSNHRNRNTKKQRQDQQSQQQQEEDRKREMIMQAPMLSRHSPWLWIRFSLTLAFAVAVAVREGPASLMLVGGRGGDGGEQDSEQFEREQVEREGLV
jgi:hypothetical protein